jgi:hypothetical protein
MDSNGKGSNRTRRAKGGPSVDDLIEAAGRAIKEIEPGLDAMGDKIRLITIELRIPRRKAPTWGHAWIEAGLESLLPPSLDD